MFSCEFCQVFKNTYFVEYLQTAASDLVGYYIYNSPFWSLFRKGGRLKLFEDNAWMFWRAIYTFEWQYYKVNYKYEHTKAKACWKNISCSFIYSFICFFSYVETQNFNWIFFFHLIWRIGNFFKKIDQTKIFQFLLYIYSIKFVWLNKFDEINFTLF